MSLGLGIAARPRCMRTACRRHGFRHKDRPESLYEHRVFSLYRGHGNLLRRRGDCGDGTGTGKHATRAFSDAVHVEPCRNEVDNLFFTQVSAERNLTRQTRVVQSFVSDVSWS